MDAFNSEHLQNKKDFGNTFFGMNVADHLSDVLEFKNILFPLGQYIFKFSGHA